MKRRDPWGRPIRGRNREALERGARRMNRTARNAMRDPNIDWYVVFALSGKEFLVQQGLRTFSPAVYLPMRWHWRIVNRTTRVKARIAYPAIAGWLLVGFERGQERWFEIFRSLASITGVLGIDGHPAAFNGKVLETFLDQNEKSFDVPDYEQFMRSGEEFAVGDCVRIMDGPFAGQVDDVREIRDDRAKIFIECLNKTHEVSIPIDNLEKVA